MVLALGAVSTAGTVFMTAVPFSDAPTIHSMGIPMYFWGVVLLQGIVGVREWFLRMCPSVLSITSLSVAGIFIVFATLLSVSQSVSLDRNVPVVWEWLAYLSSVIWVVVDSIALGTVAFFGDDK